MKVCILGDFSKNLDEGYKNITSHIADELSNNHNIIKLNIKEVFSPNFWRDVKNSESPHIIHHITSPSLRSLMILKILALFWGDAKTITSALYPSLSPLSKRAAPFFKPDLILTQSHESEKMFRDFGYRTRFLSNGVDIDKFKPATNDIKSQLREKYGIDRNKFVILHVGHLVEERNLQLLGRMQDEHNQVVIVGSNYISVDKKIYQGLEDKGCMIYMGYFHNIEELYALSDCYIFPVIKGGSILMPLSVMEAMSCNLPVISRDFDGLTNFLSEGDGLIYAKKDENFIYAIDKLKESLAVETREKVLPHSWKNVCINLEKIYMDLLSDRNDKDEA